MALPAHGRIGPRRRITRHVSRLSYPVEPCRSDFAPAVGDSDDLLIERLTAIALVLDPMPRAVLESARRVFETAPGDSPLDRRIKTSR
jgi:hypothetical protein